MHRPYLHNFTTAAKNAINLATSKAQNLGYSFVGTQHLLFGLMSAKNSVAALILNNSVDLKKIMLELKLQNKKKITNKLTTKNFTPTLKNIIASAIQKSKIMGIKNTGTQQILLEFLKHDKSYGMAILKSIDSLIESSLFTKSLTCNYNLLITPCATQHLKHKKPSKTLQRFGNNLTKQAKLKKIDPLIGRTTEIKKMEQILTRRTKNNPCLIGEPGVGKTAIIEGLALNIAKNNVPPTLKNKQIISLNLSSIIAGTKYRGDFEQRLESILNEAKTNSKIILFFDEIHTIINAGAAQGAIDAANILKPSMARGDIQIIGATTLKEYERMIQIDPALERRLQPILVLEPTLNETFKIIKGIKLNYEMFHKIKISDQAIKTAITMSKQHFKNRFLPDIAIDLIDEAAAQKKIKHNNKSKITLTSFDIANLVQQKQ